MHLPLYDVSSCHSTTLRLMQKLLLKIITMVEEDLLHRGLFHNQFIDALQYHFALGANHNNKSLEHLMAEQQLMSSSIGDKLSKAGINVVAVSANAVHQVALLLSQGFCCSKDHMLLKEFGALKLGWEDLCLVPTSAWTSTLILNCPSIHMVFANGK
uniref:Uncharacterized protein n=1 Tax=Physcomitrium patens TaxID=3218 RepID=A0A2K1IHM5_PHYPA|nr:hypothetical protein PHYPA_029364 [Physcomitrium patens]